MTIVSLLAGVVAAAFPTLSSALGGIILLGVNPYLIARSVRRGCISSDQARFFAVLAATGFVLAPLSFDVSFMGVACRAAAVAVGMPLAYWLGAGAD